MSSLHETAYPRLRSTITDKELKEYYTPTAEELKLIATEKKPILRIGLIMNLKLLQRLGYFVPLASAPASITRHVFDAIGIKRPITLKQLKDYDRSGSRSRQQQQLRVYLGIKPFGLSDQPWLTQIAEHASETKEMLADIINVMLEELAHHHYESCRDLRCSNESLVQREIKSMKNVFVRLAEISHRKPNKILMNY